MDSYLSTKFKKLLAQADHTCTICGQPAFHIYQIDGNPKNNVEDNLIVLCKKHYKEATQEADQNPSRILSPTMLREFKNRLLLGMSHPVTVNNLIADTGVQPESTESALQNIYNLADKPTLGILTALVKEYVAIKVLLENTIELSFPGEGAGRRYLLGNIPALDGENHVVVLSLADMGNNAAAARATLLLEHFSNIKAIIMVGIAGGVPNPNKPDEHVRLGDIVISNKFGIVQYDFDKESISETRHRHPPRPPSSTLLEAVNLLGVDERLGKYPWLNHIKKAKTLLNVERPLEETDILASSTNPDAIIPHPADRRRNDSQPRVFMGVIASANKLLKNPLKRDALRDKFNVKAVEMEGSGVADAAWTHEKGYLVVRGICDYCDEHKNDEWQDYAAIVAAAYTRSLLESMPSLRVYRERRSNLSLNSNEDIDAFSSYRANRDIIAPNSTIGKLNIENASVQDTDQASQNPKLDKVSRTKLHNQLVAYFNQEELKTLCFNLGMYYDDLPGEGRASKARELIKYHERHDSIAELINEATKQRPNIPWADLIQKSPPEEISKDKREEPEGENLSPHDKTHSMKRKSDAKYEAGRDIIAPESEIKDINIRN